jgi:thiopurine S-methyltransferase
MLAVGNCVFVPLCGKTRDIAWLLEQGYRVVGSELNEKAVKDLFADLGLSPIVTRDGALIRYASVALVVFVGDIFALSATMLGKVDAVFDRAALVALPNEMRQRYAAHVIDISGQVPQFVLTYTYDQAAMDGPPFSVTPEMVDAYFAASFEITHLETIEVGALKGKVPAIETAWLLSGAAR